MHKIIDTHILEAKQLVDFTLNQKSKMRFTAYKDAEFGNAHFDVSRKEKRLIRATVKTYEKTGTYFFLKLFKKTKNEFEFQQRLTLTLGEFEKLTKKSPQIRSAAANNNSNDSTSNPPSAKKLRLKQKEDEYEVSD